MWRVARMTIKGDDPGKYSEAHSKSEYESEHGIAPFQSGG